MSQLICEAGGQGIVLPFSQSEHDLPNIVRGIFYSVFLVYCFLGVSIVADTFMGAIEAVTSRRRQIRLKNGRNMTVKIWNDTVANLTLMALGSSAPEIMISIIEIMISNRMYSGELGPSTIVGSAAFNLFMIIAVCIVVIPANESRRIKMLPVFYITMVFSLFAYVWLVIILNLITPDIVDIWEALATLFFLPLLVYLAYLADVGRLTLGMFSGSSKVRMADGTTQDLDAYVLKLCRDMGCSEKDSLPEVRKLLTTNPTYIDAVYILDERVQANIKDIESRVKDSQQRCMSRAQRRIEATRAFTGGKKVDAPKEEVKKKPSPGGSARGGDANGEACSIQFLSAEQSISRDVAAKPITLTRTGDLSQDIDVHWGLHASESNSHDGSKVMCDRETTSGIMHFAPGSATSNLMVRPALLSLGEATDFMVRLSHAEANNGGADPQIGLQNVANVTMVPAGSSGRLVFFTERTAVQGMPENQTMQVVLQRHDGCSGRVGCSYHTEKLTAVPGYDYEEADGELVFEEGVTEQVIDLEILPKGRHEVQDQFILVANEPSGGAEFDANDDGGTEQAILTITVKALQDADFTSATGRCLRMVDNCFNVDELTRATMDWMEQFPAAIYCNGSKEEQADAVILDWVFHIIALPWKLLFTLVPPTSYCGGWVCFYMSLVYIALVTMVIGDLAELFGCVLDVPDSVTAITFVALGTSMPDLFASQTAAATDPWADASICNVTGSNSVNVFLGLGLPWTMAALYWNTSPWNQEWADRYTDIIELRGVGSESMVFIVPAGNFGFSVCIFCGTALVALAILNLRRRAFGAELGGPKQPKVATVVCFVVLWLSYIILASWQVLRVDHWDMAEIVTVGGLVLVLISITTAWCVYTTLQHYGWRADEDTDTPGQPPERKTGDKAETAEVSPMSLEALLYDAHVEDSTPPEPRQDAVKDNVGTMVVAEDAATHVTADDSQQHLVSNGTSSPSTSPVPAKDILDFGGGVLVQTMQNGAHSTDVAAAQDTTGAPSNAVPARSAPTPLVNMPRSTQHVATKAEHESGAWSPAKRRAGSSDNASGMSPQVTTPTTPGSPGQPQNASNGIAKTALVAQTPKSSVVRGTARSPTPNSTEINGCRSPKADLLQL